MKVVLSIVVFMLAALLGANIYGQFLAMRSPVETSYEPQQRMFATVARERTESRSTYVGLFNTAPPKKNVSKNEKPAPVKPTRKELEELKVAEDVVRLRGIFVTDEKTIAVFTITSYDKKKGKLVKAVAGDKVKGYTVATIAPKTVELTKPPAETVVLRIFKDAKQ